MPECDLRSLVAPGVENAGLWDDSLISYPSPPRARANPHPAFQDYAPVVELALRGRCSAIEAQEAAKYPLSSKVSPRMRTTFLQGSV